MAQTSRKNGIPETSVSPQRAQWTSSPSKGGVRRVSQGSIQLSPDRRKYPVLDQPEVRLQGAPSSPVNISPPRVGIRQPEAASIRGVPWADGGSDSRRSSRRVDTPDSVQLQDSLSELPIRSKSRPASGQLRMVEDHGAQHSRASSGSGPPPRIEEFGPELQPTEHEPLQYHGFDDAPKKRTVDHRASQMTVRSTGSGSSAAGSDGRQSQLLAPRSAAGPSRPPSAGLTRPASTYTLGSELRGRTLSPFSASGSEQGSPRSHARDISGSRRSPSSRPMSYIDLLSNVPYNQQVAPGPPLNNASLQSAVGNAASLLDTKKTLEMYRANVKKTNDAAVQYEFAIFMVNAAKDIQPGASDGLDPTQLITEAKHILQRLSDRAYPFAQYYLADGYFSGLFHAQKPDFDKAFPLFLAASKHGHAEAGYRAALCYEFAWGTTKNYAKAVQFYRNSASKNHPGAATRLGLACIRGDMGLQSKTSHREGLKWLKRAQESADFQYNSAPYELGLLHLTGYGDDVVFKDEAYAAQLLTQSAELGHVQANYVMGQAYENGRMGCPRDAALSVHFYNGAATRGLPEAMMALCAWYMVGAAPVLEKDEGEAFAWALQAAQTGFPKAEYAVAYFTEMGIGCRRDPLEANVWYVKAADSGDENAKQRLQIIRTAASGETGIPMTKAEARSEELGGGGKRKKVMGIF
ncbi:hypothetical protein LTR85_006313 [Meristemomyces frigidus]|nr:hypothetical protein LTR85_006313 [Meristemomyces frigidus]